MSEVFKRVNHIESPESPKTHLVSECYVAILAVTKHAVDFHKEMPTFYCVDKDGVEHQLRIAPIGDPVLQIQMEDGWFVLDIRKKHTDVRLTAASADELERLRLQMIAGREEKLSLRPVVEDSSDAMQSRIERARKEGFKLVEFESHLGAYELISKFVAKDQQFQTKGALDMTKVRDYWNQHCSTLPNIPKESEWWFRAIFYGWLDTHQTDGADIPITVPYIPNFASKGQLFVLDVPLIYPSNLVHFQSHPALGVLKELFPSSKGMLINLDMINDGLYDGEPNLRVQSQKAKDVLNRILGSRADQTYELRLMHYDEFVRVVERDSSYVRESGIYFEGYFRDHRGRREGLWGGDVRKGGATYVSMRDRGNNYASSAAMLVIARK